MTLDESQKHLLILSAVQFIVPSIKHSPPIINKHQVNEGNIQNSFQKYCGISVQIITFM